MGTLTLEQPARIDLSIALYKLCALATPEQLQTPPT